MFDTRLVFTDFDGTLSPIVERPEDAEPVDGAIEALRSLANDGWAVGVISGRPAEFLQDRLGLGALTYIGLHGLERADGMAPPEPVPEVAGLLDDLAVVRADLLSALRNAPMSGIALEDKRFLLSVHYRNTPDPDAAAIWVGETVRAATFGTAFLAQPGRMVWELVPAVPIDKGTALLAEAEAVDADSVTFLGDDIGDVHAFDALDRLAGRGVAVTRVAVLSPESPPELVRRADVKVRGPEEAVRYLTDLV